MTGLRFDLAQAVTTALLPGLRLGKHQGIPLTRCTTEVNVFIIRDIWFIFVIFVSCVVTSLGTVLHEGLTLTFSTGTTNNKYFQRVHHFRVKTSLYFVAFVFEQARKTTSFENPQKVKS